ncbi:electron transport complex subunit RsxD [Acerihabitans sp. TG2]|uniref:electron transport complex subunit RsxD n=1 Tax=Acerihabitans sp. TG2 TaxID=3096008 RepID=UPI002B23322A|nr:electron transport complex subunit RsxD [Acerihabitans sp. TG2]MEA9391124.1 electron transport complex subunit RsxD [Acerihabitans sp. TG2]
MAFRIASSPFTHHQQNTRRIMLQVMMACLPGLIALSYFFGYGTLIQIVLASLTALLSEAALQRLRDRSIAQALRDNSALLTAVLLGLSIPPMAPWWVVVVATLFAIVIAKQLYGGLGQNPFNPAMVGYVVVLISFPVQMTSWLPEVGQHAPVTSMMDTLSMIIFGHTQGGMDLHQLRAGFDGMTQATPLDAVKTHLREGHHALSLLDPSIFSGLPAGKAWQWVNLGFLAGGLYLIRRRIISWHIPASLLLTLGICAYLGWLWDPQQCASPALHLLSGATMLGAFFIATDPVTSATTIRGRLIFGTLVGLLVWLIRTFGGYPEGMAFAILLANICVPLIDYYTQPRAYGHR